MVRLRAKHLPHKVAITAFLGDSAEGDLWGEPVTVPAYVEQVAKLVVDRRSSSPTSGQEITSSTLVVLLPENDVIPRSKVTVFPGELRERTSEVVDSAGFDYPRTPSHAELRLE